MNPNQNNQDQDGFESFALIGGLFCVVLAVAWYAKHTIVAITMLKFNRLMLWPFTVILQSARDLDAGLAGLQQVVSGITLATLTTVTSNTMIYYLPMVMVLSCWSCYKAYRDPMNRLRVSHTADSLLYRLNEDFPYTTPILKLDLNKNNVKGWESSIPPHKYAKKYNLILPDDTFNNEKAEEVLKEQVRTKLPTKKPFSVFTDYEKALFTVFATRLAKDLLSAEKLIKALAFTCRNTDKNTPDYSLANDLFKKHKKQIVPFLKIHRYSATILLSMFEASKLRGKIAPSFFLWLKPVDRQLWYALNRVGAQVPFLEGGGIWSHWRAEMVAFTGLKAIDWYTFFQKNDKTKNLNWQDMEPHYELTSIFVKNLVTEFELDLERTGMIAELPKDPEKKPTQEA